jgi:hypothetical protein
MNLTPDDMMRLIVHCILLLVKMYSVYFMMSQMVVLKAPNGKNMMFIFKPLEFVLFLFSAMMVIFELYYLSYFFIDIQLSLYEYIAIQDQILFTVLTIYYLKKGGK